jgi:CRP-like cAMP-binding protein
MVSQLSVHSVEQRIAHLLLRLARKFGQPSEVGRLIQAPLSREDLAEMTGTTTESASRVISQWQKAGWIETGRQWIAVKENEKLKEILESIS